MTDAFEISVSVFDYGYGKSIKIHRFHEWAQLAQSTLVREAYNAAASEASDSDGLVWVYLKHRSIVSDARVRSDKVKVRTWLSELSGNRSMREYTIHDETDEVLLFRRSTTSVALDIATLKPTTKDLSHFRGLLGAESQGLEPMALEFPAESESFSIPRTIEPDDIDYNRHVNNAAYIRWINDAILRRAFECKGKLSAPKHVRDLQIVYLRPVPFGAPLTLECQTHARDDGLTDWKVDIVCGSGERPAAMAFVTVVD